MLVEINLDEVDLSQLGEKILYRYNLNDQAYAQAIKALIPAMVKYQTKGNGDMIESAFSDAVDQGITQLY